MDRFVEKISSIIEPFSQWIHRQQFMNALAETMQTLLPIIVIGSFGCLFAFLDIGPWQKILASMPILQMGFMNIQSLTLSCISFYVALILPYLYAKRIGLKEPIAVVATNIAVFLLLTPTQLYTAIPTEWLGHKGMITTFLITFLVVRFIKFCQEKNVTIRMPKGVPHYIEATFSVIIPAAILIFVSSFVGQLLANTQFLSIHGILYNFIQMPIKNVGTSFLGTLATEIAMTLSMYCGIHGSSVVPFMDALQAAASSENAAAISAGLPIPNVYTYGTLNIIQMGGIGATLGLGILLFFFAKSKRYKQLSRVSIIPQIFNIGEPLLFGIPIMLNPILFIPYMGGIVVNTVIVYLSVLTGLVAPFNGVNPSWTMPGPIQGLLTCTVPWQGFLLGIAVLAIDMVIWYPFVKMLDKQACKDELEKVEG